jgi:hypothetical protein
MFGPIPAPWATIMYRAGVSLAGVSSFSSGTRRSPAAGRRGIRGCHAARYRGYCEVVVASPDGAHVRTSTWFTVRAAGAAADCLVDGSSLPAAELAGTRKSRQLNH